MINVLLPIAFVLSPIFSQQIRQLFATELCCRLSGTSQREVAEHFGYRSDAGVSRQRKVLALTPM
jgi:hypothetical protein